MKHHNIGQGHDSRQDTDTYVILVMDTMVSILTGMHLSSRRSNTEQRDSWKHKREHVSSRRRSNAVFPTANWTSTANNGDTSSW